jgi:hypothetical protein
MALLLRPLYESWLLDATQAPLGPWKRGLLKQALNQDTALRCLAAELAEFSHETHAPAGDRAPDLRTRLVALATEPEQERALFPSAWVPAGAIALLLLLALVAVLQQPAPQASVTQQANNVDLANNLALAIPTPTPSPVPSPIAAGSAVTSPASANDASATGAVQVLNPNVAPSPPAVTMP